MEMEFFVEPDTARDWHQYWIDTRLQWYTDLGIKGDNLRLYEHPKEKLSHYSDRTVDIEYKFGFQGNPWVSSKASRTAPTSTSRPTRSIPVSTCRTTTRPATPATSPTSSNPQRDLPFVHAFLVDAYAEDEAPNAKGASTSARCCGWTRGCRRSRPRCCRCPGTPTSAQGQGPGRRAPQVLEHRVRRRRCDRPALPPPGRDRHTVLRDSRFRHPRGPRGHVRERDEMTQERIGIDSVVDYLATRLKG